MKKPDPITDFIMYHVLFFTGKVRFPVIPVNKSIERNNVIFTPFLSVVKEMEGDEGNGGAVINIQFKVRKMSFFMRKVMPVMSIPFFAGCAGFQIKVFLMNEEECLFRGLYRFESRETAARYCRGYAMSFMERISLPGTVKFDITSGKAGDIDYFFNQLY